MKKLLFYGFLGIATLTTSAIALHEQRLIPFQKGDSAATDLPTESQSGLVYPDSAGTDDPFFNQLKTKLLSWFSNSRPEKVYLHLDRTFFKPGESVWFSAFIRGATDLQYSDQSGVVYVEWLNTKGNIVQTLPLIANGGRAFGSYTIPPDAPGGIYKIRAYTQWQKNDGSSFERDITVQAAVLPRLYMKMEWERKAYGSGDEIAARLDLLTLDNQPLAHTVVTYKCQLDGSEISTATATTDENGRVWLRSRLPAGLTTADGLLVALIQYNGQTESISRSIPIVLNKIGLRFFPEGGDLVEGLPGVVAFEALNEHGKPADVSGFIADNNGNRVTEFSSLKFGMGTVDFTPEPGKFYRAFITQPVGVKSVYELPEARKKGYRLKILSQQAGITTLELQSNMAGNCYLTGRQQNRIFHQEKIALDNRPVRLSVPTGTLPPGIGSFTLFDANEVPQCERLVFMNRDRQLQITVTTDKEKYLPREKVKMTLQVKDDRGMPVQGSFAVSVADESLLSFADDKQGHLLSFMLLESELAGKIEEPNFYFDTKEPLSLAAMDLLMLTRGWRRFTWESVRENTAPVFAFAQERDLLSGVVTDQFGKPVPGTKVVLSPYQKTEITDEQGRFVFSGIPLHQNGFLKVSCQGEDRAIPFSDYFQDLPVSVRKRYFLHSWKSNKGTIFAGVAKDASTGLLLQDATVSLYKENQRIAIGKTGSDGRVHFDKITEGAYDLGVSRPGYADISIPEVQVTLGNVNQIDLLMSPRVMYNELQTQNFSGVGQVESPMANDATDEALAVFESDIQRKPLSVAGNKQDKVLNAPGMAPPPPAIQQKPISTFAAPKAVAATVAREDTKGMKKDVDIDDLYLQIARDDYEPVQLQEVVVAHYQVPLISIDGFSSGAILYANQIQPGVGGGQWYSLSRPQPREAIVQARYTPTRYAQVREFYAPVYQKSDRNGVRTDFRSTLFFQPQVETNAKGRAEWSFYTSDEMTTFRTTVEGFGNKGGIGRSETRFFTQLPLGLSAKVPERVLTGDTLMVPLTLMNHTASVLEGELEWVTPAHFKALGNLPAHQTLQPGESKTLYLPFAVGDSIVDAPFLIGFSAGQWKDHFTTHIKTSSRGFPARIVRAGSDLSNSFDIHLQTPVEGTVHAAISVYPNTLDEVLSGMDRMMRQPSGCFEQTSSSNYPNLLVLDYLRQTGTVRPDLEQRAKSFLKEGYTRLTGYESKSGGFHWWGEDPGHEALTAYGLMQFIDMNKVFDVDQKLIDRTTQWLMNRRDKKGSWQYSGQGLHSWQGMSGIRDAYITWALCEAGMASQLKPEIEFAYAQAVKSEDSYQLALVANILAIADDARAREVVQDLIQRIKKEGYWVGKSQSITCSTGQGFRIETTALTALALMKLNQRDPSLVAAMRFIAASKSEYGFGNTQSTVLALKALVTYTASQKQIPADGRMIVLVDGTRMEALIFKAGDKEKMVVECPSALLTAGQHRIEVVFEGLPQGLPVELDIAYTSRTPLSDSACALQINTVLSNQTAKMGETVRYSTTVRNASSGLSASPIAMIGIPAGLSPQPWQLKELRDRHTIAYYEIFDGYLVLYWDQLAGGESRTIHLDLKADIPGYYEAPASRAYLYYSNEWKQWSEPARIHIQP